MRILITDSGVGGLSVVAFAERFVRTQGTTEPVELTFANAAPANDYGYNSMATREEKIETFDRFLVRVDERYRPDLIYIACNTLSVLLPDTPFFRRGSTPVKGIVETGAALLLQILEKDTRSVAMIFGTQTTIDADTWARILRKNGVTDERIVNQACPGLADVISEDREGSRAAAEIRRWVETALTKMPEGRAPVVACLACTHYGYRRDAFVAAFSEQGITATVIDPNESAVSDLFDEKDLGGGARDAEVRFVTRYPIPESTIEALGFYLEPISPATVEAVRGFELLPDLF